jgi:protein phosphatase
MDDDEENFNLMLEQNKRDMIDYISNNNFDIIQLKNNVLYKSNINTDKEFKFNLENNTNIQKENKQIFQQLTTPILSKSNSQKSLKYYTISHKNNINNNYNNNKSNNEKNYTNDSFSQIYQIEKKKKYLKLFYGENENNLDIEEKKKYNIMMKKLDKEEEKEKKFDNYLKDDSFDGKIKNIVTRYLGESNNNTVNLNESKNENMIKTKKRNVYSSNKNKNNKMKSKIINKEDKNKIESYKRELMYLKSEYEKLLKENKNLKQELKNEQIKKLNYKEIAESIISIYEKSIKNK